MGPEKPWYDSIIFFISAKYSQLCTESWQSISLCVKNCKWIYSHLKFILRTDWEKFDQLINYYDVFPPINQQIIEALSSCYSNDAKSCLISGPVKCPTSCTGSGPKICQKKCSVCFHSFQ